MAGKQLFQEVLIMAKKKTKGKIKKLHKASSKCMMQGKSKLPEPIIRVSPQVFQTIRDITVDAGPFETGGLLLGEKKYVGNEYIITIKKATGPGEKAQFSTHHYNPDIDHYREELLNELYLNGLVYIGEWHKHPGSFNEPSYTDLNTMIEITNDDQTKDIISAITTVVDVNDDVSKDFNINFYYYRRGMKNFVPVTTDIITGPILKKKPCPVEKVFLEVKYILELFKNSNQAVDIRGRLTDNKTATFLPVTESFNSVTARMIMNENKDVEISLNDVMEDVLILVSIKDETPDVTCWQLDYKNSGVKQIDIELIDIQKNLFTRLGGLGIRPGLAGKTVTMVGLGSVGATAAVQLTKAGITDFVLIDPDELKLHNVIRHVCDLSDLGRFKVDAVAEKLASINPDVNITKIIDDCEKAHGSMGDSLSESDLFIVSTDTPDSRMFMNYLSVDLGIPSVHISLHERARSGSVSRIVPGITGCRNCVGDGRWGSEFIPGTVDYSEAMDERDILYQPGLDSDISLVTMLGVRMAIATIINPTAETAVGLGTNYIHWNGYPEKDGAMLTLGGLGIPRNEQCDVCGKKYKKNINTLIHFAKELLGSAEVQ
jgi:integrative and conjugative element protein (TIGR02256 family)